MEIQVVENYGGFSKRIFLFESPFFSLDRPSSVDLKFNYNTLDIIPNKNGNVKVKLFKKSNVGVLYHQKIKLIVPDIYFCRLVISSKVNFLRVFDIKYMR